MGGRLWLLIPSLLLANLTQEAPPSLSAPLPKWSSLLRHLTQLASSCLLPSLSRSGDNVFITSRTAAGVQEAVAALQEEVGPGARGTVAGTPCDVSCPASVEALAAAAQEHLGTVDVWISNAGYSGSFQVREGEGALVEVGFGGEGRFGQGGVWRVGSSVVGRGDKGRGASS